MTRGYEAKKERELKEDIAKKDREQRESASQRSAVASVIGSVIGAGGKVASSGIKGGSHGRASKPSFLLQDPSWYSKWLNSELFTNVPKYRNMLQRLGQLTTIARTAGGSTTISATTDDPYVISLSYCSRLGKINNAAGNYAKYPANAMWVKVLNELAKVNSRPVNQDSDVLGLYVMATGEIIKFLGWLKTNIEIVSAFNPEQGKLRDALLLSRCNNNATIADMFKNKKADLKKVYNIYSKRFNAELPAIMDMAIYARRWWVSCAIIKDHDLKKAQYITFQPTSFLILSIDADALNPQDFNTTLFHTPDGIQSLLDIMFTRIATDADMQTLIGNIRAAVDDKHFYKVDELVADEISFVEADHHALHQFHNLNTPPQDLIANLDAGSQDLFEKISSDGETLYQTDYLNASLSGDVGHADLEVCEIDEVSGRSGAAHLYDFYTDEVNGDIINESSRLHHRFSATHSSVATPFYHFSTFTYTVESCGTEFIYKASVYQFNTSSNGFDKFDYYSYMPVTQAGSSATIDSILTSIVTSLERMAISSRFDWMFKISWASSNLNEVSASRQSYAARTWETSRLIEIGTEVDDNINEMCLMSLYYSDPKSFKTTYTR